ncbi:MAG: PAS domain-containing protein [Sulfurimonas sp.]|nr:PAS domain-containing protein [Sulfurimonas sp.]
MNNREIKLDSKSFLVSETDLNGAIKFANDDYCKYSGYSLEELVGNEHNMARHPDMPKAAFVDLWKTIKSSHKWRGFIKNKSKSGAFYWVYATVYPFISCDGSRGYISCRRMVSDLEKEKYTKLYKKMKDEER